MPDINLPRGLSIKESEIQFEFIYGSGPGGQHINKNATAIQLRFDTAASQSLPDSVKQRLQAVRDRRITAKGVIIIKGKRFRSVKKNREDVLQRLSFLIKKALDKPKPRQPTRPTRASINKRLEKKQRQGQRKKQRERVSGDSD